MKELGEEAQKRFKDIKEKEKGGVGYLLDETMSSLKEKQKRKWDENFVDHSKNFDKKLADQSDWQQRGKTSRSRNQHTKEDREDRKAYQEDWWELKGALYALLALAILGGVYHFCIKKKNIGGGPAPQYTQVM